MGFRDVLWTLATLDRNVWTLALASFLNDIASEMILVLLPIYLYHNLKSPVIVIGFIEGIALAISALIKGLSGWLSDWLGHRRHLTAIGYAMSALARPVLALATSWHVAALVRWVDRVGKGLRGAPRDALIADSIGKTQRGVSYGLHRASETAGAVVSLAIALYVLAVEQPVDDDLQTDTYRYIVYLSVPFGIGAVLCVTHLARDVSPRRRASAYSRSRAQAPRPGASSTAGSPISPTRITLLASSESPRPNPAGAAVAAVLLHSAQDGSHAPAGSPGGCLPMPSGGTAGVPATDNTDDDIIGTLESVGEYTPLASSRAIAGVSISYPPALAGDDGDEFDTDSDPDASDGAGAVGHHMFYGPGVSDGGEGGAEAGVGWLAGDGYRGPWLTTGSDGPEDKAGDRPIETTLSMLRAVEHSHPAAAGGSAAAAGQAGPASRQGGAWLDGSSGARTPLTPLRDDEVVPLGIPESVAFTGSGSSGSSGSSGRGSGAGEIVLGAAEASGSVGGDADARSTAATLGSTSGMASETAAGADAGAASNAAPAREASSNSNAAAAAGDAASAMRVYVHRAPLYLQHLHHKFHHHYQGHGGGGGGPPGLGQHYFYRQRHPYRYSRGGRFQRGLGGGREDASHHSHHALTRATHEATHSAGAGAGGTPAADAVVSPGGGPRSSSPKPTLPWYSRLGSVYFTLVGIFCVFQLGNPSDAFLVLLARDKGVNVIQLLALMLLYNLVYALVSAPVGWLSDYLELRYKRSRPYIVAVGWLMRSCTFVAMAFASTPSEIWLLYSLHGAYMGIVEGVLKALIVDVVEQEASARGMAFGVFNSAMGVCDIASSFLAGILWERLGPAYPFFYASGSGCLALALLLLWSQFVGPADDLALPPQDRRRRVSDARGEEASQPHERSGLLAAASPDESKKAHYLSTADAGGAAGSSNSTAAASDKAPGSSGSAPSDEVAKPAMYYPAYSHSRSARKARHYPMYPPIVAVDAATAAAAVAEMEAWSEAERQRRRARRREARRHRAGWTWTSRWARSVPAAVAEEGEGEGEGDGQTEGEGEAKRGWGEEQRERLT